MEERNLEMDDDGKIKVRRRTGEDAAEEAPDEDDEGNIILDVPEIEGYEEAAAPSPEVEESLRQARAEERAKRKAEAQELYEEGERLYAAGETDEAGEKFLDSAAVFGEDWRPWFGIVRVQTNDFTDFGEIYDCQQAYDRAFRRMKPEDRAALAEQYVPKMREQAEALEATSAALSAEDERIRAEKLPGAEETKADEKTDVIRWAVVLGVMLAAGIVCWCFINIISGPWLLIAALLFTVLAAGSLVLFILHLQRFVSAAETIVKCNRQYSTAKGKEALRTKDLAELIRSVIDDFLKTE